MKTVTINGTSLPPFQEIHKFVLSNNNRQSVTTQPTHPSCLCGAGWRLVPEPARHSRPMLSRKRTEMFVLKCFPFDPLILLGYGPWGPSGHQLVASTLGPLPKPSLTETPLVLKRRSGGFAPIFRPFLINP